ncbi:N-acetylglucosamine-6-phosphate deacetylase [Salirhabdus salicampi]|uniref:N-acetylglucosamine-6-phosphate deacetylase n=1 Tax=Salirhabdus salicampi TaxID=476102 RepID=UPI0020C1F472|nr:N-acetylglucosamine-6-phosphate deacetylase [Salirhabdus salicampi]MCP8617812.1 N-acetylglucosamine-6-phosphate deacetylase [Salirhabdus salicampi]
MKKVITNASIYTEQDVIKNGFIMFEHGVITDIGAVDQLRTTDEYEIIQLEDSYKIIPGMIDVHIHGANGADTMDGTTEALHIMATSLPKEGTTSFLATTMTQSGEQIEKALKNVKKFINKDQKVGQSEVLGVHLEGPFINKDKAGAQPSDYIIDPNVDLFKKWEKISGNTIKLVTLAPELQGATELIQYLAKQSIVASIGHSDAKLSEVDKAIQEGVTHITHLFNQMRGFHHREPGLAGAALLRDELMVELISDGVHAHPEAVRLAFQQKGADKLILITDAMRAKCLKSGTYDLGGQAVTVTEDKAFLEDGTLAGSVLEMDSALKNMMSFSNCTLEEAILMTATNPAKELNVYDRKGSIQIGKDADLVILNEEQDVEMTFCRGQLAYKKGV